MVFKNIDHSHAPQSLSAQASDSEGRHAGVTASEGSQKEPLISCKKKVYTFALQNWHWMAQTVICLYYHFRNCYEKNFVFKKIQFCIYICHEFTRALHMQRRKQIQKIMRGAVHMLGARGASACVGALLCACLGTALSTPHALLRGALRLSVAHTHGWSTRSPGRCVRPSIGRGLVLYHNLELNPNSNCLILDFAPFYLSNYVFCQDSTDFFFFIYAVHYLMDPLRKNYHFGFRGTPIIRLISDLMAIFLW